MTGGLAARKLLQVKMGHPKNKQLLRLMETPEWRKLLDKVETEMNSDLNKDELYQSEGGAVLRHRRTPAPGRSDRDRPQHAPPGQSRRVRAARPRDRVLATWTRTPRSPPSSARRRSSPSQQRYADISEEIHAISQLLRAYSLYERDVEYVVAGGQGDDRRREHRPRHAGPPLVRRPAPGGRGEGGRHDRARDPHLRDDHDPELLPDVREARRHDGHGGDGGDGVQRHLPAVGAGDPDEQALHPASTGTTPSSRRAATSTTPSCARSRARTSAASRSSSARRASSPPRCSRAC